jgi:hypothetical protein
VSYDTEVLTDAPALYWRFEEASGLPQDASGNANHATNVTTARVTYGASGVITSGTSMGFDGAAYSAYAVQRSLGSSILSGATAFTVEAWVRTGASFTNNHGIMAVRADGTTNRQVELFYLTSTGALRFRLNNAAFSLDSGVLAANTVYHVAVVFDASLATNQRLKMYVNGSLVATHASCTATALITVSQALYVGKMDASGSSFAWNGQLDEFALYTSALSSTRVAAHYAAGTAAASITGAGASLAPLAVSAGAGTVADPAAVTGAGASVAPLASSAGAGAVLVTGAGASVAPLAVSAGSAGVLIAGAGASSAPVAVSAGAATVIIAGAGASSLPSGVSVGTGAVAIAGAGASSLPLPASAGAGLVSEFLPEITGAGASTAPLAASEGSAVAIVGGSGASLLALAASAGAGSVSIGGAGATTITLPLSSGTGGVLIAGAGASHIPLSGSGGRLRVFGGGITPASRGYVVPVEDRGYVVPLEDRGYVVPSD